MQNVQLHLFCGITCIVFITLTSCNKNNYHVTDEGLQYKIIEEGKGRKTAMGDILQMQFTYSDENDSVLYDSRSIADSMTLEYRNHEFAMMTLAMSMLTEGDSAVFLFPADSVYEKVLNSMQTGERTDNTLKWNVRISKIYSRPEFEDAIKRKIEKSYAEENKLIAAYVEGNNLNVEQRESGLIYISFSEGKGKQPQHGDSVIVRYTGKFLSGEIFDSSDKGKGFVEFVLGSGSMIKGWDEGISYMKEGGLSRLVIPSWLGYGMKGFGPIPAGTPVVFDIELVKVIEK